MPAKSDQRFFFVHVMKTAGRTFNEHLRRNFRAREVYPVGRFDGNMFEAYISIPKLLALDAKRMRQVRVFHGHFPYAVVDALGIDAVTMTVLRDPVARTLSYLKYAIRIHDHHKDLTPEELYEDPFYNPAFMLNHQAKIFSLGPDDAFQNLMEGITVDAARLEIAKENLSKIDVLGLTERFDDFLLTMERDYGWELSDVEDQNVSPEKYEPSASFISRIREDNAMDIEFYEYAKKLYSERADARARSIDGPV